MSQAHRRFAETHPVLQTRVPEEFYHRIKEEAAARRLSLAQFLVRLLDEHTGSTLDIPAIKDAWKEEGWIECAAWILTNFRDRTFCSIDADRLTRLLQADQTRWAKINKVLKKGDPDADGEEAASPSD